LVVQVIYKEETILLQKTLVVSKKNQMQQLAQEVSQQIYMADDLSEALDMVGAIDPDLVIFDELSTPDHVKTFLGRADKMPAETPVVVIGPDSLDPAQCDRFKQAGVHECVGDRDQFKRVAYDLVHNNADKSVEPPVKGHFFVDEFAASIPIVGRSAAMQDELHMTKLVSSSQCNPVLVVGETGTGKEMAARSIHQLRHPHETFVAVNCAALTANLLESELFGHVKGAFTGADRDKTGLFELAGTGTIFLDEISEMPLELQAKLLRVLQEHTFRRVGGLKDTICHATIIASSNRNLKEEVTEDRFRRDLYYRLSVCPIVLAPLRSPRRREDIMLLAEYFLRHSDICPAKKGKITSLTKLACEALQKHDWPGNVRELRNVIDRAILLETTNKVGLSSIIIDPEAGDHGFQVGMFTRDMKDFSLAKAERELIARALNETGWQKTQAASLLGITRATLYAKVKQYNIEKEGGPAIRTRDVVRISEHDVVGI
jgi:transcriptional regulator with PAS, ATPase and Fis domain